MMMRWSRPKSPERLGAARINEAAGLVAALLLFALIAAALPTRDLDLKVYHQAAQRAFVAQVDPYPRADGEVLPLTYPPSALFLIYPFSRLDLSDSASLMWAINLLLVALLMVLLVRDLARIRPASGTRPIVESGTDVTADLIAGRRLRIWGPLYVACFGGIYLTLHFHQVNLPILLCLWLYWRALRLGRASYGAGALLALGSVAKPHYGLLLLGALQWPGASPTSEPNNSLSGKASNKASNEPAAGKMATQAWLRALRPMLGAALFGLLLIGVSLLIAPTGSWDSWLRLVLDTTSFTELPPGHSSIAAPWNRSIPGEVARLLIPNKFSQPVLESPTAAALLSTGLVLVLAAATFWLLQDSMRASWRSRGPSDPRIIDLELSLLSVLVFLAAPASWTHHLVMLLPAALVLLRDAVLDPRETIGGRLTAALVLTVLALTLDDLIPRDLRVSSQAIMALMTTAVLALWLLLMERLYRLRRAPTGEAKHASERRIRYPSNGS